MSAPSTVSSNPLTLPEYLDFEVTEEDIDLARRRDPNECAITRAIRRKLTLQGHKNVKVVTYYDSLSVTVGEGFQGYRHGYGKFVRDFDSGEQTGPFKGEASKLSIPWPRLAVNAPF